jgi:DNA-directed RNA polymerase specialized sigma24 family protein
MSSEAELLKEISQKLDKMLKLLAINAVKDFAKEQEKIILLDSLGFRPVEIAKFLNKSPDNVSVVLGSVRKKTEKTVSATAEIKEEAQKTNTQEVQTQREVT